MAIGHRVAAAKTAQEERKTRMRRARKQRRRVHSKLHEARMLAIRLYTHWVEFFPSQQDAACWAGEHSGLSEKQVLEAVARWERAA